ncbi:hypothetical protein GJ496_001230 [Pomphorhynchus laevis]|nr:hypothetical protein GJ496_001230 [Pomphorhynchus laevis]
MPNGLKTVRSSRKEKCENEILSDALLLCFRNECDEFKDETGIWYIKLCGESEIQLLDQMTIQLGGRAAECSIMHSLSSGSESDLKDVTKCAYDQVRHYGMSKRLGPIAFEANDLLGSGKPYSRKMQSIIDSESNRLVAETYRRAESIVCQNKDLVVKLAGMIYKLETLNVCDVKNMLINSKGTCS